MLDGDNSTISSILNNINSTETEKIENKNVNEFIQEKIKFSRKLMKKMTKLKQAHYMRNI